MLYIINIIIVVIIFLAFKDKNNKPFGLKRSYWYLLLLLVMDFIIIGGIAKSPDYKTEYSHYVYKELGPFPDYSYFKETLSDYQVVTIDGEEMDIPISKTELEIDPDYDGLIRIDVTNTSYNKLARLFLFADDENTINGYRVAVPESARKKYY